MSKYECVLCKCTYEVESEDLERFEVIAPNKEEIFIYLSECTHCETLQLPNGYNNVSYYVLEEGEAPDGVLDYKQER